MNDSRLSLAVEAAAAAEWERITAPDPAADKMESAAISISEGCQFLNIGTDRLVEAVHELEGTPMQDVVASILNQVEDLRIELRILAEKYAKGVRA